MVQLKGISNNSQRGDTLTEVMFATAVAALVIVLSVAAMNRSFAQTQMSVETTFVRQSIDNQAELLRFARDQYKEDQDGQKGKMWRDIIGVAKTKASNFGQCYNTDPSGPLNMPNGSFFIALGEDPGDPTILTAPQLQLAQSDFVRPETYADAGQGLWVEAVQGPTIKNVSYLDLHIRACWEPPYSGPYATLGTIVRLYYEDN